MNIDDWLLPFFKEACRNLLDAYLEKEGFKYLEQSKHLSSVLYVKDTASISFSYWIEDRPRYTVMIALGHDPTQLRDAVALGDLVSIAEESSQYWTWTFHDETSLRKTITRIRNEVLPQYAAPLWSQSDLLRKKLLSLQSSRETSETARDVLRKREQASIAFQRRDFSETIKLYRELSPVDLTPADQKRFELALKYSKP